MQRREQILLGSLVGALALWQGSGFISDLVLKPLNDRSAEVSRLDREIKNKGEKKFKVDLAARRLKDWGNRSLPPDPLVASTMYQHWLINLASGSKLTNATVTPGRTVPKGDVYVSVPLTIKAEGKLAQLCEFLYNFHRADLLHRVARMTLESRGQEADPNLQITLNVEGLALRKAEPRTTLFAPGREKSVAAAMQDKTLAAYAPVTQKNLFGRGYSGPPAARPAPPAVAVAPAPEPALDVAQQVFFVASLGGDEEGRQAWLYNRTSNERRILSVGQDFEEAGVKGKVLAIDDRFVTLEVDGASWRLELGQNLRQMEKLAAGAATAGA